MDLRSMEVTTYAADAVIFATGGTARSSGDRRIRCVHRLSAGGAFSAGRGLRERGIHPGASDGDPGRRQASADERIGARRGRARVGAAQSGGEARAEKHSGGGTILFSGRVVSEVRNLVPRDIATRAIHRIVYQEKLGVDGQPAVFLDVTHIRARLWTASSKGFWRFTKVLRRRSARRADEGFSGHALHHGRDLGKCRGSGYECCRNLRGRRMRIPISRREPIGSELSGVVHFWRRACGYGNGEVLEESRKRRGVDGVRRF